MEEELLLSLVAKRLEMAEKRRSLRQLRDHNDPFSMPNAIFMKHFRLSKTMCRALIYDLAPHDRQQTTLPFTLRFLTALNFYASGTFQKHVGDNYMLVISQSSVSRALSSISELLVRQKAGEIQFPITNEQQTAVKLGFKQQYGIKHTLGALGTAHFNLLPPTGERQYPLAYLNVLGGYSIKVEGICDSRLLFTSLNAKSPGSKSDLSIWQSSEARRYLMSSHNQQPKNAWLLGAVTYPLEPWLLTPASNATSQSERAFSDKHSRAHNTIKRAFGILRTQFKCLSKHRRLHYTHERAANIVYACVILHNMLLKNGGSTVLDKSELPTHDQEAILRLAEADAMKTDTKLLTGVGAQAGFI